MRCTRRSIPRPPGNPFPSPPWNRLCTGEPVLSKPVPLESCFQPLSHLPGAAATEASPGRSIPAKSRKPEALVDLSLVVVALPQLSVALMIGGALIAAMYDLEFNLPGYLLTLGNDFFTAAYGVTIKRALNLDIPQMR